MFLYKMFNRLCTWETWKRCRLTINIPLNPFARACEKVLKWKHEREWKITEETVGCLNSWEQREKCI